MYFLFWGLIVFMTIVATFPLLIQRKQISALPLFLKISLLLLIPIFGLVFYLNVGSSKRLTEYWHFKNEVKTARLALNKIKNSQQIINELRKYLLKHPHNTQAWYLLGKMYYAQKDFKKAMPPLQKAYSLAPHHLIYVVSLAEADFFYHHEHLSLDMKKLLINVIKEDKLNVSALNLLAVNDYRQGRYRAAIEKWEALLPLFPTKSKDEKVLLSMITNAQEKEK